MNEEIVLTPERVETVWALVVASAHNGAVEGTVDQFARHLGNVGNVVGRLQGAGFEGVDVRDGAPRVARLDAAGCIRLAKA